MMSSPIPAGSGTFIRVASGTGSDCRCDSMIAIASLLLTNGSSPLSAKYATQPSA